jgi:hypothetical protein
MGKWHRVRRVLSMSAGRRKVVPLGVQPCEGNGRAGAGSRIDVSLLLKTGHSGGKVGRPPQLAAHRSQEREMTEAVDQ